MKTQSLWLTGSMVFFAATAAALAQDMPKSPEWQGTESAKPQGYSPSSPSDNTSAGGLPMSGSQSSGPEAVGRSRTQVVDELKRSRDSGEFQRMNDFYGYGQ